VKTLETAIREFVDKMGLRKLREYDAVTRWPEIVGEQIARVTEPVRIDRGVLIVRVKNGPWRNELVMRKREILDKTNESLKDARIHDIRFV